VPSKADNAIYVERMRTVAEALSGFGDGRRGPVVCARRSNLVFYPSIVALDLVLDRPTRAAVRRFHVGGGSWRDALAGGVWRLSTTAAPIAMTWWMQLKRESALRFGQCLPISVVELSNASVLLSDSGYCIVCFSIRFRDENICRCTGVCHRAGAG